MSGPWTHARRTRVAGAGSEPLLFTAAALLVVLGLNAFATQADLAAQDRDDAAEAKVRRELAPRIAAAYAQGQRDAAAELFLVGGAQVNAVEPHGAGIGVVKALDQRQDRALAGA